MSDTKVAGETLVSSKAITISTVDIATIELRLHSADPKIYAVLDSVDEPDVVDLANEKKDRCTNLYIGSAERDYWAISPYLLLMQPEDLEWVQTSPHPDSWGILAETTADLSTMKRHFRRFLTVKDASSGRFMLFRFYDPRVLPEFLESCSVEQARAFFGPISTYYFFSDPDTVCQAKLTEVS